jgi:CrcB protein
MTAALEGGMDRLNPYVIVFLGAGIGGVARHALNNAVPKVLGSGYPWATPIINITGSMLMGFLVGWLTFRAGSGWSQPLRLFVATGVLGGYTTFSTFSLETVLLVERNAYAGAFAYVLGSVVFGVLGLYGALALSRGLG